MVTMLINCKQCGVEFSASRFHEFCSWKCAMIYQKSQMKEYNKEKHVISDIGDKQIE